MPAASPPATPRTVTTKQAQRLHVIAQGLDETTLRVLIHFATGGTSDSASDVLAGRTYDDLCSWVEAAKNGHLPGDFADMGAAWAQWKETQPQEAGA